MVLRQVRRHVGQQVVDVADHDTSERMHVPDQRRVPARDAALNDQHVGPCQVGARAGVEVAQAHLTAAARCPGVQRGGDAHLGQKGPGVHSGDQHVHARSVSCADRACRTAWQRKRPAAFGVNGRRSPA